MKRTVSLIICLVLLFSLSTTSAESGKKEFVFRNGVKFDMTIEEVQSCEGSKGSLDKRSDEYRLGYKVSTIAGIPIGDASSDTLQYYFNLSDKKLNEIYSTD